MRVTQKQIAKALGLSVTTVSRALKNHPDISDETKKRVMETAQLLDYEPNLLAVRLRTGRSMILGIMVPHISNLFYESFITSVEEEAKKIGYGVMILQSGEKVEREYENLEILKKHGVDGILVCLALETVNLDPFKAIRNSKIPIVFFDRIPLDEDSIKVGFDNKKIGALAAKYCQEQNKKQVLGLFWGNSKVHMSQQRRKGFEEVIRNFKDPISLDCYYHVYIDDAKSTILQALEKNSNFDAIFCTGDGALIGTIQAVKALKTKLSNTISIIAVSNGFIPTLYDLNISTIETNGYYLGKAAFTKITECWAGKMQPSETLIDVF